MTRHCRKIFTLLLALYGIIAIVPIASQNTHVIKRGETIYSVARKYNSNPTIIIDLNNIKDDTDIPVGTVLTIPRYHTVHKGDTYYNIAKRYNVALNDLLTLNNRTTTHVLGLGEKLLVPVVVDGNTNKSATNTSASSAGGNTSTRAAGTTTSPQIISTRVATTESSNVWPHNGKRGIIKGKFPAVTFEAQSGDIVRSVRNGRVVYVGNNPRFGRVVFVQSPNGHIYIYGGNDQVEVQVGSLVSEGSIIGRVGRPGAHLSTPRIYFSIWHNNRFLDPHKVPRG